MDSMRKQSRYWFEIWFDSPYYNILYQNHDDREAYHFIEKLINYLSPPPGAKMLDLACGNGRHCIFLADKGYEVAGIDLAEKRLQEGKKHERSNLHFYRHDMREPLAVNDFDFVFNFFTSFGYFERAKENQLTVNNVSRCLKKRGIFVIDFMNRDHVVKNLVPEDHFKLEGIDFHIKRYIEDKYVIKDIKITDGEQRHFYREKVKALRLNDFNQYLHRAGFVIKELIGDYQLNAFDPENSARLIIIAEKQ